MRAHEFEAPVSLQQAQEKSLKQQAKRIQIQLKQKRLQKQRSKVADTAQQITKLQNKSVQRSAQRYLELLRYVSSGVGYTLLYDAYIQSIRADKLTHDFSFQHNAICYYCASKNTAVNLKKHELMVLLGRNNENVNTCLQRLIARRWL